MITLRNKSLYLHGSASIRPICLILFVFALSFSVFTLSYHFDNKYTRLSHQPRDGVLTYDQTSPDVIWLIDGWHLYRDRLLTPDDLKESGVSLPVPDETIFIGQYGGMDFNRPNHSPHGSATYALTLRLPDVPACYTLELPEIYSAYHLYINDRLMVSSGNPVSDSYKDETFSGSLTFEAFGDTRLLIAVSDFSHLYGGLVYPPAFGRPKAVAATLLGHICWSVFAATTALLLGIFQAVLAVTTRRRSAWYSAFLCFCFCLIAAYPSFHSLYAGSIFPVYGVEIALRYGIYTFALLLVQELYHRRYPVFTVTAGAALLFPILAMATAFAAPVMSIQNLLLFSRICGVYKILCALWILALSFLASCQKQPSSYLLLSGTCIFSSSLLADRIYPLFEPILLGWFSELACLGFLLILGVLMSRSSLALYQERLVLAQKTIQMKQQIQMQKSHYAQIHQQMETIHAMHHDTRHHITQLSLYLEENQTERAKAYLKQLHASTALKMPLSFCNVYALDVLLRYYYSRCDTLKIPASFQVSLPETLCISDEDFSIILGNLLENAIDASAGLDPSKRHINLRIFHHLNNLMIEVKNCFSGKLIVQNGVYYSAKAPERAGIGISSVRSTAEKYHGSLWIETLTEKGTPVFLAQVLLVNRIQIIER